MTKTRGGITTLTAGILNSRLKEDYDLCYVESQAEELGRFGKLLVAAVGFGRFVSSWWKRNPDLAYVHVGCSASLYRESAFIVLAKSLGIRTITHFHAGDIGTYLPLQTAIGRAYIKWALGRSDAIVAVSRESAQQLSAYVADADIAVIPNAIDLSFMEKLNGSKGSDSSENRVPSVLFVGAVGRLKGERDLVKAIAILKERGMRLRASFVGYGAEKLAAMCEEAGVLDTVDHLGPVPMSETAGFYQRADIFVLPTYAEAMPVSVMEAMAAGLPIVTTPVGGIPEIIDDGKEGFLYPCGDVDALAEKIERLITDQTTRERMGKLARKRVLDQMNFDKYIDELEFEIERVRKGNHLT